MPPATSSEFEKLSVPRDNKDEAIAALETEVQTLKDRLDETRFWAIFIFALLLDGILFQHDMPIYGIVFIFLLEAIGLLAAAKKFRIEKVVEIGERLFDGICRKFFGKDYGRED